MKQYTVFAALTLGLAVGLSALAGIILQDTSIWTALVQLLIEGVTTSR